MNKLGIEFSRNSVTDITASKHLTCPCIFRLRVASLYHEAADYTVKQQVIEKVFACKLQEIISVKGSFVIETNNHIAIACTDFHSLSGFVHSGFFVFFCFSL